MSIFKFILTAENLLSQCYLADEANRLIRFSGPILLGMAKTWSKMIELKIFTEESRCKSIFQLLADWSKNLGEGDRLPRVLPLALALVRLPAAAAVSHTGRHRLPQCSVSPCHRGIALSRSLVRAHMDRDSDQHRHPFAEGTPCPCCRR